MIPLSPNVLTIMGSVAAAGLVFALHELKLPSSRWITVLLFLYILPQWIWVSIADVLMNDWVYDHTCHEYACAAERSAWRVSSFDLGVLVIEVAALLVVSALALVRFRFLKWRYDW